MSSVSSASPSNLLQWVKKRLRRLKMQSSHREQPWVDLLFCLSSLLDSTPFKVNLPDCTPFKVNLLDCLARSVNKENVSLRDLTSLKMWKFPLSKKPENRYKLWTILGLSLSFYSSLRSSLSIHIPSLETFSQLSTADYCLHQHTDAVVPLIVIRLCLRVWGESNIRTGVQHDGYSAPSFGCELWQSKWNLLTRMIRLSIALNYLNYCYCDMAQLSTHLCVTVDYCRLLTFWEAAVQNANSAFHGHPSVSSKLGHGWVLGPPIPLGWPGSAQNLRRSIMYPEHRAAGDKVFRLCYCF